MNCDVSVSVDKTGLSWDFSIKTKGNLKVWGEALDFSNRVTLVDCWRKITSALVTSMVALAHTEIASVINPWSIKNGFTVSVDKVNGENLIWWSVLPHPNSIEVRMFNPKGGETKRQLYSYREFLRELVYALRLVMEVKGDV